MSQSLNQTTPSADRTIWDNPTGCLRPTNLRPGMRLQVKSVEELLQAFGPDHESEDEEGDLEYLLPEILTPGQVVTIKSMRDKLCDEGDQYISVTFEETAPQECWFVQDGEDYRSDNITHNEIFKVVL